MKDLKVGNRLLKRLALAMVMGIAAVGCGGTGADDGDFETEDLGSVTEAVTLITTPAYQPAQWQTLIDSAGNPFTASWMKCPPGHVIVGFHGSQQKVLCGQLPGGTTVLSTRIDFPGSGSTQLHPGGVAMHGCPAGSYMQAIATQYGNNGGEWLFCVTLQGVQWSSNLRLDTASQSNAIYNVTNPQSHVCGGATKIFDKNGFWTGGWNAEAMVGIHRGKNFLGCVK